VNSRAAAATKIGGGGGGMRVSYDPEADMLYIVLRMVP